LASGHSRRRRVETTAVEPINQPAAAWCERARALVEWAAQNVESEEGGRALYEYHQWGLRTDTVRRLRLGWVGAPMRDSGARWGLDDAVYIPRGLVLPHIVLGEVWGVKIRNYDGWTPTAGGAGAAKYSQVRGGQAKSFGLDLLRGDAPLVLCEGEKDACLLWQEAGAAVDVLALGGAGMHLTRLTSAVLARYSTVYAAYDVDAAGDKGAAALATWARAHSVHVERVTVPHGGDIVGYSQAGGDIAGWVSEFAGVSV
jgi:hypothetical protein